MCMSTQNQSTKSPGAPKLNGTHRDRTAHLSSCWELMSYRCAAAGVEEKVGSVGGNGRLVGDGSVAQRHANNGSHVSFSAKYMDGDPGGLPWKNSQIKHKPPDPEREPAAENPFFKNTPTSPITRRPSW